MQCAIVPPMKIRTARRSLALAVSVLFCCGAAHAQFKPPTKLQPKDGLGSGIGSQVAPVAPKPPASASEEKASAENVVQDIANCVLAGLPPDWTLAQIEVTELGRTEKQREFEATYSFKDSKGKSGPFTPCDAREPALNVYKLNGALDPAKRNWIRATLVLSKEGKFELQYDYPDKGEASQKPAATDAGKDAKKSAVKK